MHTSRPLSLILILISALITVVALWLLKDINFNYNIESFFSKSDPELTYYLDYRETFENDNNFVLIGITNRQGVFEQGFLTKVDSLSQALKRLPSIESVQSPTRLKRYVATPFGAPMSVPLIHVDQPGRYAQDKHRIYQTPRYLNTFFSTDTQSISLLLKKEISTSRARNDSLLLSMYTLLDQYQFDQYHVSGRIRTQHYYVNRMNMEMVLFSIISIAMVALFLVLAFRFLMGVFLPIAVLLIAIIWTLALLPLFGEDLELMLTMLPTLLFVIGISNCVHILSKYIHELQEEEDKSVAMWTTIRETGKATFLTTFTTAMGFLTLTFFDMAPIWKFGLFTATGVMITWVVSITLLPALLINVPRKRLKQPIKMAAGWQRVLGKLFAWVSRSKGLITASFVGVFVVMCLGIGLIKINNHFLDDLNPKSDLKLDLLYFEEHFSGIRPFEMGIDPKDPSHDLLQLASLQEIDRVENYLRTTYGADFLVSPATLIKGAYQVQQGGKLSDYQLPPTQKALDKLIGQMQKRGVFQQYDHLLSDDYHKGRITGKMKDLGSHEVQMLNEALQDSLQYLAHQNTYRLTGTATLMDNTNTLIATNLMKGLGVAFVLTALIIGLLFRSVKVALLSLLPNIFPLVVIAGIMGFAGIDMKVSNALIFTIAFGIAVDDTIHYLSRLKTELGLGKSLQEALRDAFLSTGKAIMITSFILSAGFITFMLSDFQSLWAIGLLISITLIIAMAADLLLLPVLLAQNAKLGTQNS